MIKKLCSHCGKEFMGWHQTQFCQAICMLEAKADVQGDCWIWPVTKGENGPQLTWQTRHYGLHRFLCELTGNPMDKKVVMAPSCGTSRCANPAHFATAPRQAPNPTGRRGFVSEATIRAIVADQGNIKEIAARHKVSPSYVQALRSGRLHSKLTGIQPKAKP